MHRFIGFMITCLLLSLQGMGQDIKFSGYEKEDGREISFDVIGKFNGNILVYKSVHWNHKISIFNKDMETLETVKLDFIPEKTFNVDFIAYPDFFYMIYQYQKKNILHCMAVKMDAAAKKIGEPVELDTTQIPIMADNKIYNTIFSENKQKIMVFKIQKKYEKFNIATLLLDSQFHVIHRGRFTREYDDRRDNYSEFALDNDGNFVFTFDSRPNSNEGSANLRIFTKAPLADTLAIRKVNLGNRYIAEVKLKVDNLNGHYILNSFYSSKQRGSIEGLFTCIWDKVHNTEYSTAFNYFDDEFRAEANTDGLQRFAFDNFFIHEIFPRKDGGFIITAEDFSSQTRGSNNPWNRWDYMNNPYSSSSYYYYNPYGYYRPLGSYSNTQSIRYYYANIIVVSIDKDGREEWTKVIHKDQFDDDDDNFLSYSTVNSGGSLHFLFNADTRYQIISDQSLSPTGASQRNATLKSLEKGYRFMPKLSKQVGARELIIPCIYREYVCFARVLL